ncbi:Transcriptional regulator, ArsR family / Methyltransferase fusion [hydrothermal vent metagenome]|uniref:Transcriptional regulator, ArsR family / Methyltransferase fusion n=1 Tax=hydrothermal vent metagenome TaxID=652676 RepID=A0A3B0W059_9ZZZZ
MNIAQVFKILADETRLRLLLLLKEHELTVAELSATLQLAQPRVSTHLAKLKEQRFVLARKDGVSTYYRLNNSVITEQYKTIWSTLIQAGESDSLVIQDKKRLKLVLSERAKNKNWVDSVAGDMERQYSPGRSWEATTRALSYLLELGDVLDIGSGDGVLAELLHHKATTYTCIDSSKLVINAAKKRLKHADNIFYKVTDMHSLALADSIFDTIFLLHALTYSSQPDIAIHQASKYLKPGGKLLISTLNKHSHTDIVKDFGHVNNGFTPMELKKLVKDAGLTNIKVRVTSKESRKPHFAVITLEAVKP